MATKVHKTAALTFNSLLMILVVLAVIISIVCAKTFVLRSEHENSTLSSVHLHQNTGNMYSWSRSSRGFDPGAATADVRRKLLSDLCPEISPREILSYRFFNETQSCFEAGEKGPCGDNMIFFGVGHDTIYGKCDCNYNDYQRILVLHQHSKKCHFAFSQGYCQHGEWIVFNKDWQPACQPNTCLKQQQMLKSDANNESTDELAFDIDSTTTATPSLTELVPYRDRCVPLGRACQEIDVQPPLHSQFRSSDRSTAATEIDAGNIVEESAALGGQIRFVRGRLLPQCIKHTWRRQEDFDVQAHLKIQCLPGSDLALNKKCQPVYKL